MVQYDARGKPAIAPRFSACERTTVAIRAGEDDQTQKRLVNIRRKEGGTYKGGCHSAKKRCDSSGKTSKEGKPGCRFRVKKYDIYIGNEERQYPHV